MELTVVSYDDLQESNSQAIDTIQTALFGTGIVGISKVPHFYEKSLAFVNAARQFTALNEEVKLQYAPDRDALEIDGYEVGAEQFQNEFGQWEADDKKVSYYTSIPANPKNVWPTEMDLRKPYLELSEIIFTTAKRLLDLIGLNDKLGISLKHVEGFGRMLHYLKVEDTDVSNPNWCGAHYDHGIFTGLMPAYYFRDGELISEPEEAGLYIIPTNGSTFEKVKAPDNSILLFQVGEFGQLVSNDKIRATKHVVKKAKGAIERYAFALFINPFANTLIHSSSELANDSRYQDNKLADGSILYSKWAEASFARYRYK
ncbi:hypothetical protein Lade_1453 [Legionella adelaidensis]|uniref:Uncharacterized protein n=1 Tax=Legionella adelaidensis TaxID=45056 RepID=A0A0W0R2F7_9GAMM|nr:2OG-Fe(II) oxygenase family protein [Legionella adelaidensis]KTC65270.1 hypothetical protein Lade_1453 [Legionella adelaidensis]